MKEKNEENKKEKPEDPSDSDDSDGSDLALESQQIQLVPKRFFRRPGPSQQLPFEVSATSSFTALTEKPSVPTVENDEKDDFRRNESGMKNIAAFIFIYFHLYSYVFMSFFFIYPLTLNYVMLPCLHISSRSNVCVWSPFSGANVTRVLCTLCRWSRTSSFFRACLISIYHSILLYSFMRQMSSCWDGSKPFETSGNHVFASGMFLGKVLIHSHIICHVHIVFLWCSLKSQNRLKGQFTSKKLYTWEPFPGNISLKLNPLIIRQSNPDLESLNHVKSTTILAPFTGINDS